jgi:hypothetical protein
VYGPPKDVVILSGTGWIISDPCVVQRSVEINISFNLHLSVLVVIETQASHLHKETVQYAVLIPCSD